MGESHSHKLSIRGALVALLAAEGNATRGRR